MILNVTSTEETLLNVTGRRSKLQLITATVNGRFLVHFSTKNTEKLSGVYNFTRRPMPPEAWAVLATWLEKHHLDNFDTEMMDRAVELLNTVGINGTTPDDVITMLRLLK